MIPALRHVERLARALARHPNHQPMFPVDAARPPARQVAAERFGLAGPAKGVAHAFLEQRVDPFERLAALGLPVQIIVPGGRPEDNFHGSISSCSVPSPASRPRTASSSRAALAGELSR